MARNLDRWLSQLQSYLLAVTSRQQILKPFLLLFKVGYLVDASAESVKLAARCTALVNSARRALWLKTLTGDLASKLQSVQHPLFRKSYFW